MFSPIQEVILNIVNMHIYLRKRVIYVLYHLYIEVLVSLMIDIDSFSDDLDRILEEERLRRKKKVLPLSDYGKMLALADKDLSL